MPLEPINTAYNESETALANLTWQSIKNNFQSKYILHWVQLIGDIEKKKPNQDFIESQLLRRGNTLEEFFMLPLSPKFVKWYQEMNQRKKTEREMEAEIAGIERYWGEYFGQ